MKLGGTATSYQCGACRFYEADHSVGAKISSGTCRRFPPAHRQPEWDHTAADLWPRTNSLEWCGEFDRADGRVGR